MRRKMRRKRRKLRRRRKKNPKLKRNPEVLPKCFTPEVCILSHFLWFGAYGGLAWNLPASG
jgi:hypothetical protein